MEIEVLFCDLWFFFCCLFCSWFYEIVYVVYWFVDGFGMYL